MTECSPTLPEGWTEELVRDTTGRRSQRVWRSPWKDSPRAEHCQCLFDQALMPRVQGTPFRCPCGANIFFARHDDEYGCLLVCNACGREYSSE